MGHNSLETPTLGSKDSESIAGSKIFLPKPTLDDIDALQSPVQYELFSWNDPTLLEEASHDLADNSTATAASTDSYFDEFWEDLPPLPELPELGQQCSLCAEDPSETFLREMPDPGFSPPATSPSLMLRLHPNTNEQAQYQPQSKSSLSHASDPHLSTDAISVDALPEQTRSKDSQTSNYGLSRQASTHNSLQRTISSQSVRDVSKSKFLLSKADIHYLIEEFPKCSPEEQDFIEDVVNGRFSISTVTSESVRSRSNISLSVRSMEAQEIQTSKTTLSGRFSPMMTHSLRLNKSLPRSPYSLPRKRQALVGSPGDFITSKVNNFSEHFHCTSSDISHVPLDFCEECFRNSTDSDNERYCLPLAVSRYKRGVGITQIWSPLGVLWVDKFGNTALHIAAALGATCSELLEIIKMGGNVHETNIGGQTFMHVFNLVNWTSGEMHELRACLEHLDFDFFRLDFQGRTFIESIAIKEVDYFAFTSCWLEMFLIHQQRPRVTYSQIKNTLIQNGANNEHLEFLFARSLEVSGLYTSYPAVEPALAYAHGSSDTAPAFTENELKAMKEFCDCLGRNVLHIATGRMVLDQEDSFDSRYRAADYFSACGLDVNTHDANGETILITSLKSKLFDIRIFKKLLQYGANPNRRDKHGVSALHVSVSLGIVDATRILLANNANIHARDKGRRGIIATGELARQRDGIYGKVHRCLALIFDAGGFLVPDPHDEWSLPKEVLQQNHKSFIGQIESSPETYPVLSL